MNSSNLQSSDFNEHHETIAPYIFSRTMYENILQNRKDVQDLRTLKSHHMGRIRAS